ncbi:hypothetical protein LOD99_7194 [Oopsacas minuta]|uniref:PRA1 family protein n=1 Tax=Oopsacas minuta TaxID=111878 RepID=A0AAV7JTB6_9METZ|nr:hypothetical protein LOD99_7194 [Oopsacas minuta]
MSVSDEHCVQGDLMCEQPQKPDFLSSSLNAAGETFVRQFTNSFTTHDLDSINTNILSIILVISSLILFYILLKFTTYYISLGFLSAVTLLHYWFGSKWCLDMMLSRVSNLYTLLVLSASYPKVSAVVVLGVIALSVWLSLRNYWLKKQKEKRIEAERLREGERMIRMEDKLDKLLYLFQDDMDARRANS